MRAVHTAFRAIGVVLGLLALQAQAQAAPIEKLALVSAIGDSMTVVVYQPTVGSNLDRNRRQIFPLPNNEFDDTAIAAATQAVQRMPGAMSTTTLVVPVLDATARAALVAENGPLSSEALRAALVASGATHALLLSKHRAEAMLRLREMSTGSGKLEGLGFYLDHSFKTRRVETGESASGFIAPYAYFKVQLVDLATWQILKSEPVLASSTVSTARDKEKLDPWNALSADEKVAQLNRLIRRETARVVPLLLGGKE